MGHSCSLQSLAQCQCLANNRHSLSTYCIPNTMLGAFNDHTTPLDTIIITSIRSRRKPSRKLVPQAINSQACLPLGHYTPYTVINKYRRSSINIEA